MANLGYIRVSTEEQNLVRQLDGVELDMKFEDRKSGKDMNRPGLQNLLNCIREGDVVYVHELSRLSRNLTDLNFIVDAIIQKGATLILKQENLTISKDKRTAADRYFLNNLGAFSQYTRDAHREAQLEGIAKAKERGVYKYRKKQKLKYSKNQVETWMKFKQSGYNNSDIARTFKVPRTTIIFYLKKYGGEDGRKD